LHPDLPECDRVARRAHATAIHLRTPLSVSGDRVKFKRMSSGQTASDPFGGEPQLESLEEVGKLWWVALLLGLISIAVGILALAYPGPTLKTIAIIFGVYLLVAALVQVALAFGEGERSRGALLLSAAVAGIAGIIVIRHPGGSIEVVALAFGIYLVIMGMMRLFAAVYAVGGRGWLILWGLVDLAAGIVIVAWPKFGVTTFVVVIAIVLLARGTVMCALAFVLRAAGHEAGAARSRQAGPATS
jgi:uncharacterized membrane protein HdeD (DUF308 family)